MLVLGAFVLPRAAESAEDQARGADVDHAVGGAAGFHAGIAQVFRAEEKLEVWRKRAAEREVRDHGFAEDQSVLIVLKLAAEPPDPRREGHAARRAPGRAEGSAQPRHLRD